MSLPAPPVALEKPTWLTVVDEPPARASGRPTWSFRIDAGASRVDDLVGAIGESVPVSIGREFTFDPLDFPLAPAARVTIGHALSDRDRVEVRASWLGGRESRGRETGVLGYRDNGGSAVRVTPNRTADVRVESEAWSAEALWRRRLTDASVRVEGIGGIRVTSLTERLSMTNFDRPYDPAFDPAPLIDAEARSFLVAGEAGLLLTIPLGDRLELGVEAKAFLGRAHRTATTSDASFFASGTHEVRVEDTLLAWGGSLELGAAWRIAPSIRLHVAIEATYFGDIARVDQAIDATEAARGSIRPRIVGSSMWMPSAFLGLSFEL